jgi:hypothetical protein
VTALRIALYAVLGAALLLAVVLMTVVAVGMSE